MRRTKCVGGHSWQIGDLNGAPLLEKWRRAERTRVGHSKFYAGKHIIVSSDPPVPDGSARE